MLARLLRLKDRLSRVFKASMLPHLDSEPYPELKEELQGFHSCSGDFSICIEARFDAAHYLYAYLPNGKDEPMHGHTWCLELYLSRVAKDLDAQGLSVDFLRVRNRLTKLLQRIGHGCINTLEEFSGVNPTAENIARWFYHGLKSETVEADVQILQIRIHEGPGNIAIFDPKNP